MSVSLICLQRWQIETVLNAQSIKFWPKMHIKKILAKIGLYILLFSKFFENVSSSTKNATHFSSRILKRWLVETYWRQSKKAKNQFTPAVFRVRA